MKSHIIFTLLLLLVLPSCVTVEDTEYKPDAEGWYVLGDMTELQLQKLADDFGMTLEELLAAQKEGSKFKRGKHTTQGGEVVDINQFETHINDSYIDISQLTGFSAGLSNSVVISPNPATTFVDIKLLPQHAKMLQNNPVIVRLQLLWEQKMLRQWEINEYRGETIKLTGDDLPGGALICWELLLLAGGIRRCSGSTRRHSLLINNGQILF